MGGNMGHTHTAWAAEGREGQSQAGQKDTISLLSGISFMIIIYD